MSERVDDLARTLAGPMPRRRLLKLGLAGLVGAALPGLRPSAANACPSCPPAHGDPWYSQSCDMPRGTSGACLHICCGRTDRCCKFEEKPGRSIASVVCCRPGDMYTCDYDKGLCACKKPCGPSCCAPDERCVDPALGTCCKVPCGRECCGHGETCVDPGRGTCCPSNHVLCRGVRESICCIAGEHCCDGPAGPTCCGSPESCKDGVCVCPDPKAPLCGNECCPKATHKCCAGGSRGLWCVPKDWTCCGPQVCPPGGQCCAGAGCYRPTSEQCCGQASGGGAAICRQSQVCCADGCCPAGSQCTAHGCAVFGTSAVLPKQPFIRSGAR